MGFARSALFSFLSTLSLVALSPGAGAISHAQDLSAPPPYVAFVDGSATLERDGAVDAAGVGMPLIDGDRLTTASGRAEVIFPDGTALDLDEYSSIDFESLVRVTLTQGRLLLSVAKPDARSTAPPVQFQIDTPVSSMITDGAGHYRVSYPQTLNSGRFDAFEWWAQTRRDERASATVSAPYLPPDLQVYGSTFDRDGAWQYQAPYGYVWYPIAAPEWRPYSNGYWTSLRPYGWTWVGLDRFAWPTHHYGRWGYARSRWFWVPATQWGPAWVTWASAPDYVSWCPSGFDNRPVFSLTANIGNPSAGWVVVPRTQFGASRGSVDRFALHGRQLPPRTPFIEHRNAPIPASASRQSPIVSRPAQVAGQPPRGRNLDNAAAYRRAVPIDPAAQTTELFRGYRRNPSPGAVEPPAAAPAPVGIQPPTMIDRRRGFQPAQRAAPGTQPLPAFRKAVPRSNGFAPTAAPAVSTPEPAPAQADPAAPPPAPAASAPTQPQAAPPRGRTGASVGKAVRR